MKEIKGEKYIYLAMAYELAKSKGGVARVGHDNGVTGGQNYYRRFTIQDYNDNVILRETKSKASFAEFDRYFKIVDCLPRIRVYEYVDENGDNYSTSWNH